MKVGEIINIRPAKGAASRTKNRIREHGPLFEIRSVKESVSCLARPGMHLVALTKNASDFKGGKESWTGWLPTEEIEVINESR